MEGAQIRIGHSVAGSLMVTQACDADGIFHEDLDTSEIAISVNSPSRVRDLASALRWLADAIDRHYRNN